MKKEIPLTARYDAETGETLIERADPALVQANQAHAARVLAREEQRRVQEAETRAARRRLRDVSAGESVLTVRELAQIIDVLMDAILGPVEDEHADSSMD
jgi:hypothetical protein